MCLLSPCTTNLHTSSQRKAPALPAAGTQAWHDPCSFLFTAAGTSTERLCGVQTHSKELQQVLDVVVSHQALELKCELVVRLLYALVSPRAEHFRPLLRRLAGLVGQTTSLS